jgi:hypothetical protein
MVLAAKIFEVKEGYSTDILADKLKKFRLEREEKFENESFTLVTEVKEIGGTRNMLEGIFAFDTLFTVKQRGELKPYLRTFEAPFTFDIHKGRTFLTIYEKKNRANNIANEMSKALFMSLGQIVEARITPETLRKFHEENFEDTKIVFFDDVDIPNIKKLSLYGSALGITSLYNEYLEHGKLWYTVIKSKKYGYIVGITRNCVVTVFSRIELPEFKSYIRGEVIPLIS